MASTYSAAADLHREFPTAWGPGRNCVLVTPSDTVNLPVYAKALRIYAAAAGDTIRITPIDAGDDDSYVTLTLNAGVNIEPGGAMRVWNTGSTDTLIIHAYTK